jgi:hypothetical protein
MSAEVFGARVALSTAFEGAFELAIRENFATATPSLGGLTVDLHFFSCHEHGNRTRDAEYPGKSVKYLR